MSLVPVACPTRRAACPASAAGFGTVAQREVGSRDWHREGLGDGRGRIDGCRVWIERLHRLLLDVIKDEFDRAGMGDDLNSVQALLLYNIGDSELTAGELKTRG